MDICNCSICRNRIGKGESATFGFLKISGADLKVLWCLIEFLSKDPKLPSFDQSPLYGRVTKKYDIYRNNNKKKPGYFGKIETVGTKKIFFMK